MKAFIPEIDSKLRLNKDWTFDLHFAHQNSTIFTADGHPKTLSRCEEREPYKRTLPAGSEFLVSRIYVRNGAKDFSSITLYITKTTDKALTAVKPRRIPFEHRSITHYGRFWVKLTDFNDAEFEVIRDAAVVGDPVLVRGEICTMSKFGPSSKYPKYWVKFEHDDPELCFDDLVCTHKSETVHSYDSCYNPVFPYTVSSRNNGYGGWHYFYEPIYFVGSLIPESWSKTHENNERFHVKEMNPFNRAFSCNDFSDVIAVRHPFEKELNIPKDKKQRILLGIPNGKAELKDIEIAGGKLTIFKVKEEIQ